MDTSFSEEDGSLINSDESFIPSEKSSDENDSDFELNSTLPQRNNSGRFVAKRGQKFKENVTSPTNAVKASTEYHETYFCGDCGESFMSNELLQGHIVQSHVKEKRLSPSSKMFSSKVVLEKLDQTVSANDCRALVAKDYHSLNNSNESTSVVENRSSAAISEIKDVLSDRITRSKSIIKEVEKFKCTDCNKELKTSKGLIFHKSRVHTKQSLDKIASGNTQDNSEDSFNQTVHSCFLCDKYFRTKDNLQTHFRIFHNVSLHYDCENCMQRFRLTHDSKQHICEKNVQGSNSNTRNVVKKIVTTKEYRSVTYEENTNFEENANFEESTNFEENTTATPSYKCKLCDSSYKTKYRLQLHEKWSHKEELPSFACKDCPKTFSSQVNLVTHIQNLHLRSKSYHCINCQKSYKKIFDTKKHLFSCLGKEKKGVDKSVAFTCEKCPAVSFLTKQLLEIHLMKEHVTTKVTQCRDWKDYFGLENPFNITARPNQTDSGESNSAESGNTKTEKCDANAEEVKWLLRNYEIMKNAVVKRSTMYDHYLEFCSVRNLIPVGAASFGKLITSVFYGIKTQRLGGRDDVKYFYSGICRKSSLPPQNKTPVVVQENQSSSQSKVQQVKKGNKSTTEKSEYCVPHFLRDRNGLIVSNIEKRQTETEESNKQPISKGAKRKICNVTQETCSVIQRSNFENSSTQNVLVRRLRSSSNFSTSFDDEDDFRCKNCSYNFSSKRSLDRHCFNNVCRKNSKQIGNRNEDPVYRYKSTKSAVNQFPNKKRRDRYIVQEDGYTSSENKASITNTVSEKQNYYSAGNSRNTVSKTQRGNFNDVRFKKGSSTSLEIQRVANRNPKQDDIYDASGNSSAKTVQCEICDLWFHTESELKFHYQTHNLRPKKFACGECPGIFSSHKEMIQHLRVHRQ